MPSPDMPYWWAFNSPSKTATGDPGFIARRAFSDSSHIAVSAAMGACRRPGPAGPGPQPRLAIAAWRIGRLLLK